MLSSAAGRCDQALLFMGRSGCSGSEFAARDDAWPSRAKLNLSLHADKAFGDKRCLCERREVESKPKFGQAQNR